MIRKIAGALAVAGLGLGVAACGAHHGTSGTSAPSPASTPASSAPSHVSVPSVKPPTITFVPGAGKGDPKCNDMMSIFPEKSPTTFAEASAVSQNIYPQVGRDFPPTEHPKATVLSRLVVALISDVTNMNTVDYRTLSKPSQAHIDKYNLDAHALYSYCGG